MKNKMELCKFWQSKLNLDEWRIKFNVDCKTADFINKDVQGEVELESIGKSAVIRIQKEEEYPEDCILPFNFEKTLIHELLHIKFCQIEMMTKTDVEDNIVHHMIDNISIILTELRKEEQSNE